MTLQEHWDKQLRERYEKIRVFVQDSKGPVAAQEVDALVESLPGSEQISTKDIYANVVYTALNKRGITVLDRHLAAYQGHTAPREAQAFNDWIVALDSNRYPENLPRIE
jgi:hypothetical protein